MPPPRFAIGRSGPLALIGAIGLLLTIPAAAQAQTIRGVVLDAENDIPIAVAQVALLNRSQNQLQTVVTNGEGRFSFDLAAPGRFHLRATRIGYREALTEAFDVLVGEVMQVQVRISTRPIELPPLTVLADRPPRVLDPWIERGGFYEREVRFRSVGRFLHVEDLERLPLLHIRDIFRNTPGLRTVYSPGRDVYITGIQGRSVCYYLNGKRLPRHISPDELIIPSMIVAVEIYAGGIAPGELGGGGCAAIGIWTGFREP